MFLKFNERLTLQSINWETFFFLKVITAYKNFTGRCPGTIYDNMYSWTKSLNSGRYVFNGFTNTKLFFDGVREEWRLEFLKDPKVYAKLNISDYPFGEFEWEFFGKSCDGEIDLEKSSFETMTLSLNACFESEFNCIDGRLVFLYFL